MVTITTLATTKSAGTTLELCSQSSWAARIVRTHLICVLAREIGASERTYQETRAPNVCSYTHMLTDAPQSFTVAVYADMTHLFIRIYFLVISLLFINFFVSRPQPHTVRTHANVCTLHTVCFEHWTALKANIVRLCWWLQSMRSNSFDLIVDWDKSCAEHRLLGNTFLCKHCWDSSEDLLDGDIV